MGKYYFDQIYWALETAGYLNELDPIDGSDIHQGFNPCHGKIEIPKPVYKDKIEYTSDKITPNFDVSYTEEMTPGSGMFPNGDGMDYRDPFLKLCFFPHKAVTGTWSGGAGTYGKIIGDFTLWDNESSIMMQYGMTDGVTPINRCLNGVRVSEIMLGFKAGGILKEKVRLEASFPQSNTQAFITNANFDDGQWSLWSLKGAVQKIYPAAGIKVYWDDAHAAEFAGLKLKEFWMHLKTPRKAEITSDQLYVQEEWVEKAIFQANASGILKGNTEYLELEKLFKDKIKKDLRMAWDTTTNELKWLQIQDAHISSLESYHIPARGERRKVNFTLLGNLANYEGNFENLPDPSSRIDS